MDWIRGKTIGHGSFGRVSLAIPTNHHSVSSPMVVKSCSAAHSVSLINEKLILEDLQGCPDIIRCFGGGFSVENGERLYNVLLEFASQGNLADKIKNSSDRSLSELEIRKYTKALLRGVNYIHKSGYVHCDVKLQNILLDEDDRIKIADFGLAKKRDSNSNSGCELRGTPMYMSPEMVAGGEQGTAVDVWAVGCVVAEMATGAPPWIFSGDVAALFKRISGEDTPEIPRRFSLDGQDFLRKCFVKDPRLRWTAEMLLNHPFVSEIDGDDDVSESSISPRSPFDFQDWVSEEEEVDESSSCEITFLPLLVSENCRRKLTAARLRGLISDDVPLWSEAAESCWISVR